MDEIIERILQTDLQAQKKLEDAVKRKNEVNEIIERNKKDVFNKYIENAQKQLEKARNDEINMSDKSFNQIKTRYLQKSADIDDAYEKNSDKWVEMITSNVIRKASGN